MSQPNSKRKRSSQNELHQTASRDASDEDNGDTASTVSMTSSLSQIPSEITEKHAKSNGGMQMEEEAEEPTTSDHHQPTQKRARDLPTEMPSSNYPFKINPPPVGRPVRIYCDGIYDLFHYGHAKALEQAKKSFKDVYLIVGVCSDAETHKRKGMTVLTDSERYESLRHCRWVDEVVEDAPWVVDQAFLDKHQIDYVAHDDIPYESADSDDVYAFVKSQGKFLPTRRTKGVSTSDLIKRIVRDYDLYVRRNLERGMSPKELNVSFLKEQEIKARKSLLDIRKNIQQNWTDTHSELGQELSHLKNDMRELITLWEERSQEFVRGFAGLFGADVMNKLFRRRQRQLLEGNNGSESGSDIERPSLFRWRSVTSGEHKN
ncbi:uncharacterized protein VTP21DRAFT_7135 [Calcarisporiella thermophila]|uniref:uncharacterized protein n=1 Tax=Calcarisporiella thermophila TaxID=911321 RepID=UPI00374287D3